MPRLALALALLPLLLVAACDDGEERADPPPRPPAVQQRTEPLWCPTARYEQRRRDDGRYDVEREPLAEDLRPNRVNVTVERGYVTALQSVG